MKFTPDEPAKKKVVYFEDVSSKGGYAGQGTTKSEDTLISEITSALVPLNTKMTNYFFGKFTDEFNNKRDGFVFEFIAPGENGNLPGVIRIAALPLRNWTAAKEKQARKAALFQLRNHLTSSFQFDSISVGFSPIVPFMLGNDGETISEAWQRKYQPFLALPAPIET